MKKRLLATVLTAAMAVSMLAGCSTPGGGGSSDGGDAADGKVFRFAYNTEPSTFDSTKALGVMDNEIQSSITEGLTRNTAGDVQPALAEDWDMSDDGLTYTFHLRDAKWSDGEPITAEDFVYSWQRLVDPETAATYGGDFGRYIKNGKPINDGEMDVSELAVKAVDEKTFEVTLDHPTPYFLGLIGSSCQFAPLRQDVVEEYGTDFAATADKNVYSGPFVMTSSDNNKYIFDKNENYWDKDSINFDRVEITYVEKPDTQLAMYEDGKLDFVQIPSAYVDKYRDDAEMYVNGNVDYFYINHNSKNPAITNKNFRLALNYAVDRVSYASLATNNTTEPSNSLVYAGLSGAEKTYGEEYTLETYPMEGDEAQAKSYLEAAMKELNVSDPSEISVEITTTDAESSKKIAEVVQEMWKNVLGIDVTIRQVTWSEIYGEVLPGDDYDLGYGGWMGDYDDPLTYLDIFNSANTGGNYGKYNNPDYDALLNASLTETDPKTRMDNLFEAEQILIDDAAFVPMQMRDVYYLIDDDLEGISFYHVGKNIDWVYGDVKE